MRVVLWGTISGLGGMQTNTRALAHLLLDERCDVLILSSVLRPESGGEMLPGQNDALLKRGATIVWLPVRQKLWQRLGDLLTIAREVRRFRPDLIWGTATSWHLGLLPLFAPRRTRSIFFEGMSGERFSWKDPRWLVRLFYDEVVGQSPIVAQNFARSFRWRRKLAAIPAFSEPLEKTSRLPKAEQHRVPYGTARAAFFGRLAEGKQAYWLVQQWPALKSFISELHIHGRGPEREKIEAFISENQLNDKVRCFGAYPSGQEHVDLLSSYDMTLLPTTFPEGAPLVLLESMACGVPFVANGVGGIPDYAIGNPDCIVVADQSKFLEGVRSMAEKLDRGAVDQARLQQFYLSNYSNEALRRRWLEYLFEKSSI